VPTEPRKKAGAGEKRRLREAEKAENVMHLISCTGFGFWINVYWFC